jgi:hypothetical protein
MLQKSSKIKLIVSSWLLCLMIFSLNCKSQQFEKQRQGDTCNDFDSFILQHWKFGTPDSVFMGAFYYNKWTSFENCIYKLDKTQFEKIFGTNQLEIPNKLGYELKGRYEGTYLIVGYSPEGQITSIKWDRPFKQ